MEVPSALLGVFLESKYNMSTLWNAVGFILPTIAYFSWAKPKQMVGQPIGVDTLGLGLYVALIVAIQWAVNVGTMSAQCGGSLAGNMGAAALITVLPWLLIFCLMILALMAFPHFKDVFSNVFGYFLIAGSANKLLSQLLVSPDVERQITQTDPASQQQMREAAQTVVRILGNTGLLINQITPLNFEQYWQTLTPLMRPGIEAGAKQELFDLVSLRDTIGEATWYCYTAILVISLTSYYAATRGCVKSPKERQADYAKFVAGQEADQKKAAAAKTTYTV
ncbi:MAG: hypothetical protein WA154_05455 [Moraxellaceae bacterium]